MPDATAPPTSASTVPTAVANQEAFDRVQSGLDLSWPDWAPSFSSGARSSPAFASASIATGHQPGYFSKRVTNVGDEPQ